MLTTRSLALAIDSGFQETLARTRAAFLADPDAVTRSRPPSVRAEILQSWRRSWAAGVDPDGTGHPEESPTDSSNRLARAALPVMDNVADQLDGTRAWAILLDHRGRQIGSARGDSSLTPGSDERGARHGALFREDMIGTNSAGMALERLDTVVVVGHEHYREEYSQLVTVAAPIRGALGRVLGVISVGCLVEDAHSLLVPFAREMAWDIREKLLDEAFGDERSMLAEFASHSRRPARSVIALSDETVLASRGARELLAPHGHFDLVVGSLLSELRSDAQARRLRVPAGGVVYELRLTPISLPSGSPAVLAAFSGTRRASASDAPSTPADRLAWARSARLGVYLRGESGSGKSFAARAAATGMAVHEFDARVARLDPDWFDTVVAMGSGGAAKAVDAAPHERLVLIRHLDELAQDRSARLAEALAELDCWLVGTGAPASEVPPGFTALVPTVVDVVPLRERSDEIPALIGALEDELARISARPPVRFSPEASAILVRHPWPENVAELRQTVASAVAAVSAAGGREVRLEHLPAETIVASTGPHLSVLQSSRRRLVLDALGANGWNRDAAAEALGMSRATIYRTIKEFGIRLPTGRGSSAGATRPGEVRGTGRR